MVRHFVTAHAIRTTNEPLDQLTLMLVVKGIVVRIATEANDSLVSGMLILGMNFGTALALLTVRKSDDYSMEANCAKVNEATNGAEKGSEKLANGRRWANEENPEGAASCRPARWSASVVWQRADVAAF